MSNHSPYLGLNKKFFLLFLSLLFLSSLHFVKGQDAPAVDISQDYGTYLRFHWKGALTSHSIMIKAFPTQAFLDSPRTAFVVAYTKTEGAIDAASVQVKTLDVEDEDGKAKFTTEIKTLTPSTQYYYVFLFGSADTLESADFVTFSGANTFTKEFKFKTLGVALTPTSFTFGLSCCTLKSSTNAVFTTLSNSTMDFFLYTGDMYDDDITTNNQTQFYDAYYNIFDNAVQKDFFQNIPLVYIWDDDDFGGSDGKSPTKEAVTAVYKDLVPTYPLREGFPQDDAASEVAGAPLANSDHSGFATYEKKDDDYGIFRSFIIGRCLFVVLDLRSFKDVTAGDILGADQAAWLQNQLHYASRDENIIQVFLVSTIPWVIKELKTEWTPYNSTITNIQTWIENYITKAGINKKIMLLGGHSTFVAFDDGTNNAYGKFPVFQAGALDQNPTCQGGTFSHGLTLGRQQYGIITVTDATGATPCVQVKYEKNGVPTAVYDTCNPAKYPAKPGTCSVGIIDTITDVIGGGSWAWFIIAMVAVVLIVAVILYKAYQSYKARKERLEQVVEGENYLEMTESSKKRKNNNDLL